MLKTTRFAHALVPNWGLIVVSPATTMALGLLISIVKLAAEFGWFAADLLSVLFCKPAAGCLTGVDGVPPLTVAVPPVIILLFLPCLPQRRSGPTALAPVDS
jgi:hypothetical protein